MSPAGSGLGVLRRAARRLALAALRRLAPGDIDLRHHHTGDALRLHPVDHKGYWWHGKRREAATMRWLRRALNDGDTVVEAGGHIGYVTLLLARAVGDTGHVWVFEPAPTNLRYLRHNTCELPNVDVLPYGLGHREESRTLYVEHVTGQNTSFVRDFAGSRANGHGHAISPVVAQVTTLDAFAAARGIVPTLVKVDVEGFEWEVLQGAAHTLEVQRPLLMVEVQSHADEIFARLTGLGYWLFSPEGLRLTSAAALRMNTLCLDPLRHPRALAALGA